MEQGSATQSETRKNDAFGRLRPPGLLRFVWRGESAGAAAAGWLERELAERAGFQWMAVCFGLGALIYFALPREPMLAALLIGAVITGAAAAAAYRRGASWRLLTVVAVAVAGASAAKMRVDRLDGPTIERPVFAEISGRVISAEHRVDRRPRIVLDDVTSAKIAADEMPRRIRLSVPESHGLPSLGSRISLTARLGPVAGPVTPGGYDPRRAAYFEGIGASGFSLGPWRVTTRAPRFSLNLAISRIRAAIVARIIAAQPGEAGAVAAALLVGERSGLSAETNESLRISGLAHILSISGLHMMLIAGTAFFTVRAALALSPGLTLGRPIRKWSALAALLVVTAYLALSGGGAATVRAYVMAVIVFAAILIDRPAISMRNLAIAAFVVLALEPEGVTEPGFQMSFAAVAALIAAWGVWRDRERVRLTDDDALPGFRILRMATRALAGVAITTLVAGFATAPFAAYHFERVASYSLLGNLLAAPLVSFIIMPFGLLTLVMMPLGLEAMPLAIMAAGIDLLLAASDWVARLPGAEITAPPMPPASLFLITGGMLWLCLWRLRWRLLGLPVIGAGLTLIPLLSDPPDLLVAPDGRAVAVRDGSGLLRVSGSRSGSYVVEQFFDEEKGPALPAAALREGVRCDPLACILAEGHGLGVSHVLDPAAFPEDCGRLDVILTPLASPPDCVARLVVDAARLEQFGSHAIRITAGEGGPEFRVTTERTDFPRPWQAGGRAGGETSLSISEEGP